MTRAPVALLASAIAADLDTVKSPVLPCRRQSVNTGALGPSGLVGTAPSPLSQVLIQSNDKQNQVKQKKTLMTQYFFSTLSVGALDFV